MKQKAPNPQELDEQLSSFLRKKPSFFKKQRRKAKIIWKEDNSLILRRKLYSTLVVDLNNLKILGIQFNFKPLLKLQSESKTSLLQTEFSWHTST